MPILLDDLEAGDSLDDFLLDFPSVRREHAVAVLEIAGDRNIFGVAEMPPS